jgi:hypothetical protein
MCRYSLAFSLIQAQLLCYCHEHTTKHPRTTTVACSPIRIQANQTRVRHLVRVEALHCFSSTKPAAGGGKSWGHAFAVCCAVSRAGGRTGRTNKQAAAQLLQAKTTRARAHRKTCETLLLLKPRACGGGGSSTNSPPALLRVCRS